MLRSGILLIFNESWIRITVYYRWLNKDYSLWVDKYSLQEWLESPEERARKRASSSSIIHAITVNTWGTDSCSCCCGCCCWWWWCLDIKTSPSWWTLSLYLLPLPVPLLLPLLWLLRLSLSARSCRLDFDNEEDEDDDDEASDTNSTTSGMSTNDETDWALIARTAAESSLTCW